MTDHRVPDESRRRALRRMLVAPLVLGSPAFLGLTSRAWGTDTATSLDTGTSLAPTPMCGDDDDDNVTEAQTEGPYFKPRSPERVSVLEANMPGTKLLLTGTVVTRSCRPVANALLDFWQADNAGQYDNVGFRLRGHQFTDAKGEYRFETVVPGLYPGRTRHIHVKVQAPGKSILTTQLYFPGEAGNARDGIFDKDLLMQLTSSSAASAGRFTFVLDLA